MRVETKDGLTQMMIEAGHHTDHDNQNGDPQGDAHDRNQTDYGNKRPFGPQIPQRQQQFKRQPRHERRLDGGRWGVK